ncbi:MAG: DUF2892 domain-containing protein [Nitrospirae bacterium]|nr:DUF2892 domain-containing protein [Nitrospirota bacterium]
MTCNVGGIERPIRIGVGLVLLAVGIFAELPAWGVGVAYVFGAVAVVTGVIGFCPAWSLLGINTCPTPPAGKKV